MSVGDRVRARRKALGMTATALAKLLGVGSPRLARIELTKIEPRADVIRTLAKAWKVSADYLLGLDDKPRRLRVAKAKKDQNLPSEKYRRLYADIMLTPDV